MVVLHRKALEGAEVASLSDLKASSWVFRARMRQFTGKPKCFHLMLFKSAVAEFKKDIAMARRNPICFARFLRLEFVHHPGAIAMAFRFDA